MRVIQAVRTTRVSLPAATGWMMSAVLVLVLSASAALAQSWTEHSSRELGYRIEFPAPPDVRSEDMGMLKMHSASAERGDALFYVVVTTSSPGVHRPDPELLLEKSSASVIDMYKVRLREKRRLTVNGASAYYLLYDADDHVGNHLFVYSNTGLYRIVYRGKPGTETSADVQR